MSKLNLDAERRLELKRLRDSGLSSPEIARRLYPDIGNEEELRDVAYSIAACLANWTQGKYTPDGGLASEMTAQEEMGGAVPRGTEKNVKEKLKVFGGGNRDNEFEAVYTGKVIRSVADLMEEIGVDLEIWYLHKHEATSWTQTMGAQATGKGEPQTYTNFRIHVKFIRQEAVIQRYPIVKPVTVSTPEFKRGKPPRRRVSRALIVPDSQNGYKRDMQTGYLDPFHDRRCWDLIAQVNRYLAPDVIVYLGDMLDLTNWSDKFLRSDGHHFVTQPSLNELHWWLQLMSKEGSEAHYLEGNHEFRIGNSVTRQLIEAASLRPANMPDAPPNISVPAYLNLQDLGIEYHGPYPTESFYWLNDNVRASHGEIARKGSGKSVEAIIAEARSTEICGHTHRLEAVFKTYHPKKGAVTYSAFSAGTIARIDDAVPAAGSRQNWHQGFLVVDFTADGWYHIDMYSINDGVVMLDRKLFEAGDQNKLTATISEAVGFDLTKPKK